MKKILLLLLVILVLGFASEHAAFAGLGLSEIHHSRANIVSGIVDYTSAKFSRLEIFVASNDADVKTNHLHSTGTLKLSSGNYSYWDGLNLVSNSGEARTLKLVLGNNITQTGTHQSIKFIPVNNAGEQVYFYGNADSGLNGVETVWRLNNAKDFNDYTNLPNIRTTSQQLSTFVPYIEYIFVEHDDDSDSDSDSDAEDTDSQDENSDDDADSDSDSESEDDSDEDSGDEISDEDSDYDSDSESEADDSENDDSDSDLESEDEDTEDTEDTDESADSQDETSDDEADDLDSASAPEDEDTDEESDYDPDSDSEVFRVRRTAKNNVKRVTLSELARRADEENDLDYTSENVTYMKGFNFSVINSQNNSTPVTLPTNVTFTVEDMYTIYGESVALENITASAKTGEVISGSVEFGSEVPVDVIAFITVRLDVLENGRTNSYKWRFHGNELSGTTSLTTNHVSEARFKNNASIYKSAKFKGLYLTLNNPTRVIDSKYVTTGLIDIPAGGYTLCDASNSKRISKVAEGTSTTLPLIPADSLNDRNFGAEYFMSNGSKKRYKIILKGDVEKNLNGQTLTWTFPDNLNLNGSATIPNYTTTTEQLEEFVPYVETVSSDNNAISALSYRIVDRYDTITPISPDFRVDFKIAVYVNDVMAYESDWLTESCEGVVDLGNTFALNNVSSISVMLRTFENEALPCTYQWNFINKRSSGGDTDEFEGCNLNFGFTGVFTLMGFALIYSGKKFWRVKK